MSPQNLTTTQEAIAAPLSGAELVRIVQGGMNAQVNLQLIAALSLGLFSTQINDGTVNSGTATLNVSAVPWHRLTVGGAITLALVGWPPVGSYAQIEIELINGGFGVTFPPTINWLRGDGSSSNSFSSLGVTLNNPGTNWIFLWSRDAGSTIWGRAA